MYRNFTNDAFEFNKTFKIGMGTVGIASGRLITVYTPSDPGISIPLGGLAWLEHYPWVTGSEELALHQGSNMPIKGNPDPKTSSPDCTVKVPIVKNIINAKLHLDPAGS